MLLAVISDTVTSKIVARKRVDLMLLSQKQPSSPATDDVAKFHMMLRLSGMSWNNVRRAKVKNRQYLRSS